jgi:nucleoside-diphosphate-sugar epimerase
LLAGVAQGRTATENDAAEGGPRIDSENAVIALADRGVRSSVIRLSPLVHSTLDHHGFAHRLIDIAREKGVSAYIGDGANRWPGVHTLDAARLYRLAVEAAPAGTRLHGVADEGVRFRDIAAVIGRHLDLPVVSISAEQAYEHFGFLSVFGSLDNPTSSALTQKLLDWHPDAPGLIEDLDEGHYFGE